MAADESILGGTGGPSRLDGLDAGPGREVGLKLDFAWTGAALVEGSHGLAPAQGSLREVSIRHLDADQLFGFGKGGGGDFRADRGSSGEGGRLARRCGGLRRGGRRLLGRDFGCVEFAGDGCAEQT